jgi:hypothetical protein
MLEPFPAWTFHYQKEIVFRKTLPAGILATIDQQVFYLM